MGREKSDGRVVPPGRRKASPTARVQSHPAERQGKATTNSKRAEQLELNFETADNPKGNVAQGDASQLVPATVAVPKSESKTSTTLPPMTMEEIAADENLRRAWRHVASNRGAAGPDGEDIERVRVHLNAVIDTLHRSLLDGTYRPGMTRRVWIPKAGGGQRGLGIPNVCDRIVQQAVHQVLGAHYEPTFHRSSHGFRPERSCHTAIAEAREHLRKGYTWVVDIDLSRFFDRVHHQRLIARLEQRIDDARVVTLIHQMLKAKVVMPDGVVVSTEEGTPQGGPLSPLLSNIVLDELDWELERRGHHFVRYADDCNIYVRSKRAGDRVMESVVRFLERKLRLVVNSDKSAVARPEERHFLGFRVGAWKVLLSKRSEERLGKKIRELIPRCWGQPIKACVERLNRYLLGWIAFFYICDEPRIMNRVDGRIRRRIRAVMLKQWKRRPTMYHRLLRLGADRGAVVVALYKRRHGWWALSHAHGVQRTLHNRLLAKRFGLLSLEREWKRHRKRTAQSLVRS